MTTQRIRQLYFPETRKYSGYLLGVCRNRLSQGDSLDILRQCPAGFATLIVTSPPYNIGKEYETQTKLEHYLKTLSRS